jgi:hypothetical protein
MPSKRFEARDRQRFALAAGHLHPVISPAGRIVAVAHLRDGGLKAGLADVLVHLAAIDLEALAVLDIRLEDDLLEQSLALEQRQLAQVVIERSEVSAARMLTKRSHCRETLSSLSVGATEAYTANLLIPHRH